jgi:hypothetical protein
MYSKLVVSSKFRLNCSDTVPDSRKGLVFYLGFLCAIFWGAGTNVFSEIISPWWYVSKGVSIGEIFFVALIFILFFDKVWRRRLDLALSELKVFSLMMTSLALILLLSVAVNSPIYGGEVEDYLACSRLLYFLIIAIFIHAYVKQYGVLAMLQPFILGLMVVTIEQCAYAFLSPEAVILRGGIPMIRDPNVAGALFGYGIIFCALALLHRARGIYWFSAAVFGLGSVLSFSKASWIMVFLGYIACMAAGKIRSFNNPKSKTFAIRNFFVSFLMAILLLAAFYENYDKVESLIAHKMETTQENASIQDRFNQGLVGLIAIYQHPFLGVGYRNYDVVGNQYPDLVIRDSGNANNAFIQIGAVGGVASFFLIIFLFLYPFKLIYKMTRSYGILGKIYSFTVFLSMFIFASVQTQLITQPIFWVFIGLISASRLNIKSQ